MNLGFYIIMAAQFFSSLADNALLVAAIAMLMQSHEPSWLTPYLKFFFVLSYVILAPYVGAIADRLPKGQVMLISNTVKIAGCVVMLFGVNPLAAYALVGLGAAAYSPAKYGILTEYLPPTKLVLANGWIEGLTVASIILGTVLGGVLINHTVAEHLLAFDLPLIDTGVDTPPEAALCVITFVYAVAALFNLYVPLTGAPMRCVQPEPAPAIASNSSATSGCGVWPSTTGSWRATIRLPDTSATGGYLSRIPCRRSSWSGWMNVRPTYRFLISPSLNGIPVAREKPIAAGVPESGIGRTRSASAGASAASRSPIPPRAPCNSTPSRFVSGRAR